MSPGADCPGFQMENLDLLDRFDLRLLGPVPGYVACPPIPYQPELTFSRIRWADHHAWQPLFRSRLSDTNMLPHHGSSEYLPPSYI